MKGKVIFAVLLSISFSGFATERSPHWSYEGSECKYPCNPHHSLLEIFRHTDYVT